MQDPSNGNNWSAATGGYITESVQVENSSVTTTELQPSSSLFTAVEEQIRKDEEDFNQIAQSQENIETEDVLKDTKQLIEQRIVSFFAFFVDFLE